MTHLLKNSLRWITIILLCITTMHLSAARRKSRLRPGDDAPEFTLQGDDGKSYTLSDFDDQKVVLFFYPLDRSPRCTRQVCSLSHGYESLKKHGVKLFGINHQSIKSHAVFKKKHQLPFTLLSDPSYIARKQNGPIIPWKKAGIEISAAPALTGKQMGTVHTPGVPPLGYELDGNVKVFRLIAQPIKHLIVDEAYSLVAHLTPPQNRVPHKMHRTPRYQKIKCWGYNGSTPGPTIEANEGDRVRIIVKNELPEPTSVHWHGIELPNDQDGAAPETQHPIMPGEEYTYEFTLYQSGTVMYHSGYNVMRQDHMGLTGAFVIHPKKYEPPIDKDFVITLQQWAIPPGSEYLNLVTMDFNWFTFNGRAAPNVPVLTVSQGERIRIRFTNIIMDSHPIHLHGYIWNNVGTEGGPIQPSAQTKGSTILVPAGTTRDVEFTAWNPGVWRMHCHKLHHIVNAHAEIPMGYMDHGGMFTLLHVIPKEEHEPWKHPNQKGAVA